MINGIKPQITTTTKLGIKPTSFNGAMDVFCQKLEQDATSYIERFDHMESVTFRACGGRKYIKVKSFEDRVDTEYHDDGTTTKTLVHDKRGSIHCFVDSKTGDIYKPAGWKTPYTKGNNCVRGNIYDSSTFEKTDLYGGWLYDR